MSSLSPNSVFKKGFFSGVRLLSCKRFTEKSNIWNFNWHKHPFVEIIYFMEGGARIFSNRDDLTFSIYDIVIYPEHTPHKEKIDLSNHQEIICLWIEFPNLSGLDRIRRLSDLKNRLRWLFVEIHRQSLTNYTYKYKLLDNLLQVLMYYIKQQLDVSWNIQDPVSRVIHFLHENLAKTIRIEKLARLANYSSSYLNRKFKERTGSTPINYLDRIRLEAAWKLLGREDMAINQIATLIGYKDPKYFSRRFKSQYGVPPNHFRSSNY